MTFDPDFNCPDLEVVADDEEARMAAQADIHRDLDAQYALDAFNAAQPLVDVPWGNNEPPF